MEIKEIKRGIDCKNGYDDLDEVGKIFYGKEKGFYDFDYEYGDENDDSDEWLKEGGIFNKSCEKIGLNSESNCEGWGSWNFGFWDDKNYELIEDEYFLSLSKDEIMNIDILSKKIKEEFDRLVKKENE